MATDLEFVSIACNRVANAADYSLDGTVAYAAGHFVAIYHPQNPSLCGVKQTLRGHKGRVNCVRFIRRGVGAKQYDQAILSGSADKTCRIWKKDDSNKYKALAELKGHTAGINCVAVLRGSNIPEDQQCLVVAGALDGCIRVWQIPDTDQVPTSPIILEPIQSFSASPKYPLCMTMACLPNSRTPVLITGNTDNLLRVYAFQTFATKPEFTPLLTLHGHKDWIRAVDIATYTTPISSYSTIGTSHCNDGDLILASASQDKYIRLWKITPTSNAHSVKWGANQIEGDVKNELKVDIAREGPDELIEFGDGALAGMEAATKSYMIDVDIASQDGSQTRSQYSIMFDALLVGHDDWVHSVFWQLPSISDNKTYHQPMKLISSSTDRSIFIWSPDADTTLWINEVRVGDISGVNLGFYGAIMSPDGRTLLSHAYNGAVSIWEQDQGDSLKWVPRVGVSGHAGAVTGLEWDPEQRYFVTVSNDQTTRLWCPWIRDSPDGSKRISTWHEMARPQIHGYDLQCVAFVDKYCFVSGADEKVIRVFQAPTTFLESFQNWTGAKDTGMEAANLPLGASLPALGLSNKAVYHGDSHSSGPESSRPSFDAPLPTFTALTDGSFAQPPFEHHLSTTTLWPEVNKLYGHGFEIYSLGCSRDGKVVASSCKAAKQDHAAIKLWSTSTWKELSSERPLVAHALTVTDIKFSPDDKYILTVGRDRMWSLFIRTDDEEQPYKFLCNDPKAHSRIIWDADWSSDGIYFATASRDKTIKIWHDSNNTGDASPIWHSCVTIKCEEAVTSVAFMPGRRLDRYCLAAGLEDGRIILYMLAHESDGKLGMYRVVHLDVDTCHCASVTSIKWAPTPRAPYMYLSSCSEDHSVRLWTIDLS
ncbi:hypothetical protein SeLEV6574_g05783 [Synchytrium endobioticum]|uniref:Elongator complex protein 2 n=1 Tax=Synchytrium endobioticum TaxID=286115 RepID=A0A507CSH4_9FUNG|nr:hypothetical protein SeLEV6574_g05783 [Synchytrium endobioticum]